MFTPADLSRLRFLEGRWRGEGPDGRPFYEAYDFPEPARLRSRRYPDAEFSAPTDGSTVALEDGEIVSRWGAFTWRAVEVAAGRACFDPVDAPSSFCWRRVDDDHVDVVQRWTDEDGRGQTYTVTLERVR